MVEGNPNYGLAPQKDYHLASPKKVAEVNKTSRERRQRLKATFEKRISPPTGESMNRVINI